MSAHATNFVRRELPLRSERHAEGSFLSGLPPIFKVNVRSSPAGAWIESAIRNGRGSMPPYNRIEEMDRWDVVNYVRGLQGMLAAPVDTGAYAMPGVGGRAVPGFTELAPTRSSPWKSTVPPGRSTSDPTRTTAVPGPLPPSQPADSAATPAGEGQP